MVLPYFYVVENKNRTLLYYKKSPAIAGLFYYNTNIYLRIIEM
jgi:hypothetical protein